jgi:catechol 2,3-dioxygenase-like lactoylglutathione lyase family enzyme
MLGLRHVGIVVRDMDKALDFYQGLLKLKIVKKNDENSEFINKICGIKDSRLNTIKLSARDGNLIELLYFVSPTAKKIKSGGLSGLGLSHVSFTVKNITKEYNRLKKAGVFFNSRPQTSPDGYAKVVFCRDYEGNYIELVEVLRAK